MSEDREFMTWLAMVEDCLETVMRERLALAKGYMTMPRKQRSTELEAIARGAIDSDLKRRGKGRKV